MIEAKLYPEPDLISDCCGAEVYYLCDGDYICCSCKEHCDVIEQGGSDESV